MAWSRNGMDVARAGDEIQDFSEDPMVIRSLYSSASELMDLNSSGASLAAVHNQISPLLRVVLGIRKQDLVSASNSVRMFAQLSELALQTSLTTAVPIRSTTSRIVNSLDDMHGIMVEFYKFPGQFSNEDLRMALGEILDSIQKAAGTIVSTCQEAVLATARAVSSSEQAFVDLEEAGAKLARAQNRGNTMAGAAQRVAGYAQRAKNMVVARVASARTPLGQEAMVGAACCAVVQYSASSLDSWVRRNKNRVSAIAEAMKHVEKATRDLSGMLKALGAFFHRMQLQAEEGQRRLSEDVEAMRRSAGTRLLRNRHLRQIKAARDCYSGLQSSCDSFIVMVAETPDTQALPFMRGFNIRTCIPASDYEKARRENNGAPQRAFVGFGDSY